MSTGPDFETYLVSKKIDSAAFRRAEPEVWVAWKKEFEQMHANSFTVQKLNLLNPIRRKYLLTVIPEEKKSPEPTLPVRPAQPTPKPGKPVIRRPGSSGSKDDQTQ